MAKKIFGHVDTSRKAVNSVVVFGLGRFGSSLALELMANGVEVLGIDTDEDLVQSFNGLLTQVVRVDPGVNDALEQLKVAEYDVCVVAIGGDILAGILTASYLKNVGAKEIWAKAVSDQHGQILQQVGVDRIVFPEKDMGKRVAHIVKGAADFIEVDNDYAIVKSTPNQHIIGVRLGDTDLRKRFGVTIMAVKQGDQPWVNADNNTVLKESDHILVAGPTKLAEEFALRK